MRPCNEPPADAAARCRGKAGFVRRGLAERVLRRMRRRQGRGRRLEVYRCPVCGLHHIGEHLK